MADQVVRKGRFAEIINVSAGRVSQMIADGIITGDALVGEGRNAQINVEIAKAQIRKGRDLGQALGNGLGTRLDGAEVLDLAPDGDEPAAADVPTGPRPPSTDEQYKLEKLEKARRENRLAEEEDLRNRGRLMDTVDARREMTKAAADMMIVFEGALPDFASALASKFELPQRDVLHELKQVFTQVRQAASERQRKRAAELPETHETIVVREDP